MHKHSLTHTHRVRVRSGCCGAVCARSVGGRRWLWCIVVALHDPEAECNVSAVQYRGLPDLHASTTPHHLTLSNNEYLFRFDLSGIHVG